LLTRAPAPEVSSTAPSARPRSIGGTFCPACGTPVTWKSLSVKFDPWWHSMHAALPTNSFEPRTAAGLIAESSPAYQRSYGELVEARRRRYSAHALPTLA